MPECHGCRAEVFVPFGYEFSEGFDLCHPCTLKRLDKFQDLIDDMAVNPRVMELLERFAGRLAKRIAKRIKELTREVPDEDE